MLDTNMLIYLLKNKPVSVAERINNLKDDDELCMSFFTCAELLKGAERRIKKDRVLRSLKQLTRQIPVRYTATSQLCVHYAEHFTHIKEVGTPIGANDLWIACHALADNAVLVTHDTREFNRVTGLVVEGWVS